MYFRKLSEKKKQEDYEETEADSVRVTAQELEDAWEDELEAFIPAPRITGNLKLHSSFQNYLSIIVIIIVNLIWKIWIRYTLQNMSTNWKLRATSS